MTYPTLCKISLPVPLCNCSSHSPSQKFYLVRTPFKTLNGRCCSLPPHEERTLHHNQGTTCSPESGRGDQIHLPSPSPPHRGSPIKHHDAGPGHLILTVAPSPSDRSFPTHWGVDGALRGWLQAVPKACTARSVVVQADHGGVLIWGQRSWWGGI